MQKQLAADQANWQAKWSQIMEHEDLWPLATDLGISDPAVAAATVSVVQRLIDRVAALEAA